MQVKLLNRTGAETGVYDLPESLFGVEPRSDLLARVVRWQLARRQTGNHQTKVRSDVSGTTKKMYRQKGTGNARHGAARGAQFRGGGIIFGPVVHSHAHDLPKKVRALGLKMALSAKAQQGQLFVVEDFEIEASKTKTAKACLTFLQGSSALLIDGQDVAKNMKLAVGNLAHIDVLPTMGANVYDILKKDKLVLSVSAVKALGERLK